jgi:DnaJ-class molecular chaperone
LTEGTSDPTYYDLLGIEPNAPAEKIKVIYRLRSRQNHPDRSHGNEERQKQLNGAYEILSDPEKRKEYNERLGLQVTPRPLKPGQTIYEEIQLENRSQTSQVAFSFNRWDPCRRCWGEGCQRCQGRGRTLEAVNLTVTVPAGVSQVVVKGQGARSEPGGSRGDLILYVIWKDKADNPEKRK